METLMTLIVGFGSGVIGWLLTEFIAKPFRRAIDTAAEAAAAIIEYANVSARSNAQGQMLDLSVPNDLRLREAEAKFRRLSASLAAFAQIDKYAYLLLKRTIFDAEYASVTLLQLSNNIGQYGAGRKAAFEEAKKALKVSFLRT